MVRDYFTAQEVADILEIDLNSAEEMLCGIIMFEKQELEILAAKANISVEQLAGVTTTLNLWQAAPAS